MDERNKKIAESIEKSGYSYAELSELTGISKSTLQRYATGETKKIPIDNIERIAKATKTDPRYLMGWEQSTHGSDSADSTIKKEDPPLDATESEILILARKTKDLPESDRKKLVKIFESSINTFLEAQNKDD